ncbi:PEP-CTERM/exosortase system-associated acyltransferase [Geobacter argillaceus]|uniref:N-acyl amino acid synthase of PEP-CTERM/exosortase system n=1 Tax=Geobacter argillaceus TaxID=345631 RepID=A0A562VHJ6_9BACT|nr:PEP-CTERM/exosortase system-associated acyltransferase [Geobacter argillaceus]TWJ17330.1 N-acyl amino acid synthase of PEP-CTERM/exosortase system [Geobacter argillaceus]
MYFDFMRISKDSPLIEDVYKLRYKVYCDEWGFERPEDHSGRREVDKYDPFSSHFGAIRKDSGQLIGTIRVIGFSDQGFPIEEHSTFSVDLSYLDRAKVGEISRLAVSKEYRRRLADKIMLDGQEYTPDLERRFQEERRRTDHDIVLGLYSCIYQECLETGLTHLYAVMADGLQFLLRRAGVLFQRIGPTVEYHGKRTPYLLTVDETMDHMAGKNPELYKLFLARAAERVSDGASGRSLRG